MNKDSSIDSPSFFYKYYPLNKDNEKFIKRIFTNDELYFSSSKQFNDPFDSKNPLSYDGSYADWENYFQERIDRYIPGLNAKQKQEKIKELIKNIQNGFYFGNLPNSHIDEMGVFCMTEKKNNILMWAHYADGHKGLCLEFQTISTNPFFVIAQKIDYRQNYSKPNIFTSTSDEQMQAKLLIKAEDWEYEKEWRIINHDNGPGIYNFPKELLTGVILGCKISEEYKKIIKELIANRKPQPKLYQAEKNKDAFSIDIIEIQNQKP